MSTKQKYWRRSYKQDDSDQRDNDGTRSIQCRIQKAPVDREKADHGFPQDDTAKMFFLEGRAATTCMMDDHRIWNVVDLPACFCDLDAKIHIHGVHKIVCTESAY